MEEGNNLSDINFAELENKNKNVLLHTKYDGPIYFNYEDIEPIKYVSSIITLNQYMMNINEKFYFERLKDSIITTICTGEFFIHNF